MQTAYLYIRVSTEEQAIKGYSQRSQLDRLTRVCIAREITILKTIFEDHSAKTFDRPEWSDMMSGIKRHKFPRPDLILFTKWDRFSRNAGDAYYMIAQLRSLDIQPQAIDQELDLSVPENKIILGVYLATSEAENDRRSLNVRQGIHKANQEGRWTAHVPLGYRSQFGTDKKRNIVLYEPEATFIRQAFYLVAKGIYAVQAVYDQLTASGFKCSVSNFRRLLRNPVYCGKIAVHAFENDVAYFARGIHEPLIDQPLFDKVQDVLLKVSRRSIPVVHKPDEQFLLRGYFYCPGCNKRLTGSASKGKMGILYFYYHCTSSCGFRIRADKINALFFQEMKSLQVHEGYLQVYKDIIKHVRKDLYDVGLSQSKSAATLIDRLIERIVNAKELLIKGEIDNDDYCTIKKDCEHKIHLLGKDLQSYQVVENEKLQNLSRSVLRLSEFGKTFGFASVDKKKEIVSVILTAHPVMNSEIHLSELLNSGMVLLFNLNGIANKDPQANVVLHENRDHLFWNQMVEKINKVARAQTQVVDKGDALIILNFLTTFARIIG